MIKIKTLRHKLFLNEYKAENSGWVKDCNDKADKELGGLLNDGWEIVKIDHFNDFQDPQIRICTLIKKEM